MKHIILEGGDSLGKNTLVERLCNHYDYNNITVRHFDKPPKGMAPKETLDFQFEVFYKEMMFAEHINDNIDGDELGYHENILIWNRSHLGEYVYSQMFRGISKKDVAGRLRSFEERNAAANQYLITLTASPQFFLAQEDGESFSQDLEQKTTELLLFKEAHSLSMISRKKLIKVNQGNSYREREHIWWDVLELIGEVE